MTDVTFDSDVPYDRHPAFETVPSATDIAHWYVENKRGVENVGGDAWWLSREPHGSARMLAFVDGDVQEFWLLDIATEDTKDLLFVTNGLDGMWCEWWQHPRSTSGGDLEWMRDGLVWMADQIVRHYEHVRAEDAVGDEITEAIYEQALEDEEPWALESHEHRAGRT